MKHGICRLCEEERELCNSHSLPASAFNYIFRSPSSSGKAVAINSDDETPAEYSSDSWDVPLLCKLCEKNLNDKYDSYGVLLLRGAKKNTKRNDLGVTFSGIDRQRFRMFVLSLLWRISISSHKAYSNIDLPYEWEDELHKALKNNTKVRRQMFTVTVLRLKESSGIESLSLENLRNLILTPFARQYKGFKSVGFLLFGFVIEIFLPKLPIKGTIRTSVLEGNSPVFLAQYLEVSQFPELFNTLDSAYKKHIESLHALSISSDEIE